MNKTIIYTVITDHYDTIKQPLVVEEGVEYFLFTNNPEIKEARIWKVVQIKNQWQRYTEWGFKDDLGISENGLLIRRHNDARVAQLMELWWKEYQSGCLLIDS
jgi:hypothetical protein